MRLPRSVPWLAVAGLLAILLSHEWFGADIWYHLYLGERVARTLSPQPPDSLILHQANSINLYWLFQLLVRGVYGLGGIAGVDLLFMGFWAAALGFWLRTAGLPRAGAWGAGLLLAAVVVCQTRFEPRPEVLSFVFLAMQIHWLTAWGTAEPPPVRDILGFGLVEAAWANVHGYFIFGPVLVALRIASLAVARPRPAGPGVAGLWKLLGLTVAASLASPFGFRTWAAVVAFARVLRQLRFSIQELLPPASVPSQVWTVHVFWVGWAALLAAVVWTVVRSARRDAFALLLAAMGLGLSTLAFRNIPLVVFLGAPLLGAVIPRPGFPGRERAWVAPAVTGLAVALAAWAVSGGFYRSMGMPPGLGTGESRSAYPVGFSSYLRADGFRGSIFNAMEDGGYLEFHFPGLRLYGDSRLTEVAPVRRYLAALRDPARFHELQASCGFDAALLPVASGREVIAALLREGAWRLAYADLHRAFFVNRLGSAGAAAPGRKPAFYGGEDLTLPENLIPAVTWVALLAELGERRNFLLALDEFSSAEKVPSTLVDIALEYGRARSDPGILDRAKALRSRTFQTRRIDPKILHDLVRFRSPEPR
jgi:hypothetical protein